MFEKDSQLFAL